jgi:hypothetical protein
VGLQLSGAYQLLVYDDDDVYVNLLGDNIDTIMKNTGTLTDASKEVGLETKTVKTRYILLSCHQNVWKNHDI